MQESGMIGTKEVKWFNYYDPELKHVVDIWCDERKEYVEGWCGMTRHEAIKLYNEKILELESGTTQSSITDWMIRDLIENPKRNE